MECLY